VYNVEYRLHVRVVEMFRHIYMFGYLIGMRLWA